MHVQTKSKDVIYIPSYALHALLKCNTFIRRKCEKWGVLVIDGGVYWYD